MLLVLSPHFFPKEIKMSSLKWQKSKLGLSKKVETEPLLPDE